MEGTLPAGRVPFLKFFGPCLFQFDSSDDSFEDYSPKKGLENLHKDISVTFDSSSDQNSTDNNATDYHDPDCRYCVMPLNLVFNFTISGSVC